MRCPQCSNPFESSDRLVSHLSNAHDASRIDARKQVIENRRSTDPDQNQISSNLDDTDSASASDRDEMLDMFRQQYQNLGRMPTLPELNDIHAYTKKDYVDEFGSVFGTAVFADLVETNPEKYSHDTNGSEKYSEWDLVSELWRLYELTGKVSVRMMDNGGKYSSQTYQYRFGSWSEALRKANIKGPKSSVAAERNSRQKHYGSKEWRDFREQALERDNYECQSCGMTEEVHQEQFGVGLNVHHLTDIAEFDTPREADSIGNLETLCVECHGTNHPFSKE